ncbi:hypothetical protein [Roseivivax isoporae]|uniref:Colicin transporter n=1 Tax=Roseivivax isoporae LMG 25204 TaxID=1449351 RepID=X7FBH1_9RHOB|nr:hypothetical protein [Roseivivax isoporae]ETX29439.1 hypothetical protein RISW2_23170 [Roseivivax isoporae LMG 25204]
MTEIDELERRIAAALDRIARGVEAIERPAPEPPAEPEAATADTVDPEAHAALATALEDERLANAQLEERVRALHDRQERQVADLRAQVTEGRESLAALEAELQQMRRAHETLREANAELTRALAEGAPSGTLIDAALAAELESLRAERAVETAETRAVLSALEPLLAEAAATQEGETA